MDKKSISKMLAEVFGETSMPQFSEPEGSSSKEDDIEMEDYEEAQNPNTEIVDAEEEYNRIVALYCKGDKDKTV